MQKMAVLLCSLIFSCPALSGEFREVVVGTPQIITRQFKVDVKECLANLRGNRGVTAPSNIWSCNVVIPVPNAGQTYIFNDDINYRTEGRARGLNAMILVRANPNGFKLQISANKESNGGVRLISLDDARAEVDWQFANTRIGSTWWPITMLVVR